MDFRLYLRKGAVFFYERRAARERRRSSALRPGLLTQPSSAILADETASVECPELRAGVSCLSFLPLHLPSPSVFLSSPSFPPSFNSVFLARSRRIDLSHALAVPRYIDLSLRPFPSRPRRALFFAAPSFSVAPRLPLFLVVITSLLLVISLRAIRSLGGRSSYGPIGCTQAC